MCWYCNDRGARVAPRQSPIFRDKMNHKSCDRRPIALTSIRERETNPPKLRPTSRCGLTGDYNSAKMSRWRNNSSKGTSPILQPHLPRR